MVILFVYIHSKFQVVEMWNEQIWLNLWGINELWIILTHCSMIKLIILRWKENSHFPGNITDITPLLTIQQVRHKKKGIRGLQDFNLGYINSYRY